MSSSNYDTKNYIDIRGLRKKAAKATGCHNAFSRVRKERVDQREPRDFYPSTHESSPDVVDDELALHRVCQETRIEDLEQRIPPITSLLIEMVEEHHTNGAGAVEMMEELVTELEAWGTTLDEAIEDFHLASDEDLEKQAGQLQTLAELREQVTQALDLYNSLEKDSKPEPVEDLIRWSSFAVDQPTTQQQQMINPFAHPANQNQQQQAAPSYNNQQQAVQQGQQMFQQAINAGSFDPFAAAAPKVQQQWISPTSAAAFGQQPQKQVFDPFASEDPFAAPISRRN